MLVDTHCHIYKEYYDDIDILINNLEKNGIKYIINNACNLETCKEVIDISNKYKNVYFTLGLHPQEDLKQIYLILDLIKNNLNNDKFLGIGEIGLDYYWNKDNKEEQKKIFETQLKFAQDNNLPVIIHSRESTNDVLNILKKYNLKGIIHCFNGSVETAKEYIKLGYKLGMNGVITFKNCKLIDVIREIGVDNIVLETDSPFLTPVPYRGNTNEPSCVHIIADFISNQLNINKCKLEDITNKNVNDIFDINI